MAREEAIARVKAEADAKIATAVAVARAQREAELAEKRAVAERAAAEEGRQGQRARQRRAFGRAERSRRRQQGRKGWQVAPSQPLRTWRQADEDGEGRRRFFERRVLDGRDEGFVHRRQIEWEGKARSNG